MIGHSSFRNLFKRLVALPGWHTNRKIVVIESDDWGSIRMPSKDVFDKLEKSDLNFLSGGNDVYNRNDALETSADLELLYNVLETVKDKNGQPAKITAVSVVANPDFDKIKENNFECYIFEPFTQTYNRNRGSETAYNLRLQGIDRGIFIPQFHAREHLNVSEWMRALQRNDQLAKLGFENRFWGYDNTGFGDNHVSFQAAFDFNNIDDLTIHEEAIKSGLSLFNELFGFGASYFVPTNGPFNNSLEKIAKECGIKFMYAARFQSMPIGQNRNRRIFHYMGQRNKYGQLYLLRNCMFEPSYSSDNWVDLCLSDIDFAFKCFHPAVICTHRVNYIGAINESNRANGLKQLEQLLKAIVVKWPDVEFMTSDQLGELMNK